MEKSRDGKTFGVVGIIVAIDGIVDHCQECIGIDPIVQAGLVDSLVAETEIDSETAEGLQHVVVVADKGYHLVVRLIYLVILHISWDFK